MRYSKQRELILNIVQKSKSHPTAEEIYNLALEQEPNISFGTVYRDLKQLSDSNLISIIKTNDDKTRYDRKEDNHNHFICTKCGKIFDVMEKIELSCNNFGVTTETKIAYYGICNECLNKK